MLKTQDFPGDSAVKNLPANTCQFRRHGFEPWVGKIPWRRKWQPTPVFLPGKAHGQRSQWATVHRVTKSQMCLSIHTNFSQPRDFQLKGSLKYVQIYFL